MLGNPLRTTNLSERANKREYEQQKFRAVSMRGAALAECWLRRCAFCLDVRSSRGPAHTIHLLYASCGAAVVWHSRQYRSLEASEYDRRLRPRNRVDDLYLRYRGLGPNLTTPHCTDRTEP